MDTLIVFFSKYLIVLIGLAALVYLFIRDRWFGVALLIASAALSFMAGKLAGLLWYNPLPFVVNGTEPLFEHAANNGFPSDHTLLAAAAAWAVFCYNRTFGSVLLVLTLVVGFARMYAGVHHLVDILAAVAIAGGSACLAHLILKRIPSREVQS